MYMYINSDKINMNFYTAFIFYLIHDFFNLFSFSLSIFTNLWEKTFCKLYLKSSDEFTNHLLFCQLRKIQVSEAGGLADRILRVLPDLLSSASIGSGDGTTRVRHIFVLPSYEQGFDPGNHAIPSIQTICDANDSYGRSKAHLRYAAIQALQ
jgi:hypothetical protein